MGPSPFKNCSTAQAHGRRGPSMSGPLPTPSGGPPARPSHQRAGRRTPSPGPPPTDIRPALDHPHHTYNY